VTALTDLRRRLLASQDTSASVSAIIQQIGTITADGNVTTPELNALFGLMATAGSGQPVAAPSSMQVAQAPAIGATTQLALNLNPCVLLSQLPVLTRALLGDISHLGC
jgi:hypothetical protein